MWFQGRRALYGGFSRIVERNTELERELAAERANVLALERQREALERQLAISQGTQEWMMATVNELKQERAVLFERILQVSVPVPIIAREPVERPNDGPIAAEPQRNVPPDLDPALLRTLAAAGPRYSVPMRGPVNGIPVARPADAPALADLGSINFDDMGDEEAQRQGVVHNAEGEAVYTR